MTTRDAGDRSDPEGIPELFFEDKLGYSDAAAIETAANFVHYLDTWGLRLTPTKYLDELETRVGEKTQLPRGVLWGQVVDESGQTHSEFNAAVPGVRDDGV
ncbi:hypothetical protein [Gordonia sp. OPL2]|uniref:hypothetical protein n=1 Tax=Gordonia sp. OPL2 TaxID=2486274 RepID=UPI00165547D7|nr:hypothetical protein [Gordonia sp. OPL2]ROZ88033.1 hypothetical protein EEB19_22775 [Gordonia sp. OPL2]